MVWEVFDTLLGFIVLAAKFGDYCEEKEYAEDSLFNQNYINMLQCELSIFILDDFFSSIQTQSPGTRECTKVANITGSFFGSK